MEYAKIYNAYDDIQKNLQGVQRDINKSTSPSELWKLASNFLRDSGCKSAMFYSTPDTSDERNVEPYIKMFFAEDKTSLQFKPPKKKEIELFIQNIDKNYPLSTGLNIPYSTLLFGEIERPDLKATLFDNNYNLHFQRHFGPTGLCGYSAFSLSADSVIHANLLYSAYAGLFCAIHNRSTTLHNKAKIQKLKISPRETDVLSLLVKGKTNCEIATCLGISPHTARAYLKVLSLKLNSRNRTMTALLAVGLGLSKI